MDVLVEIGQEVAAGQPLVHLDTTELNLALERAESAMRQTEAQLGIDPSRPGQIPADEEIASVRTAAANRDDAHAQLGRAQELISKGLLSKAELDTIQTRVKVGEAAYQSARENVASLKASLQDRRAAFELAQKKLADSVVKAPVGGSISERLVNPGEYIRENTPVASIVQMNPLKLKTAIQERHASLIKAGQAIAFTVEAFPDRAFAGKIAYVSPAVDQATRTFPVEALVDNADRKLKPGFFAKGTVQTHVDAAVMAVPEDAISTLAGVSTVYVIEDGKARQQQVTLGARSGKLVEIVDGLKGAETLATSNLSQLATGVRIAPPGEGTQGRGRRGGDEGAR